MSTSKPIPFPHPQYGMYYVEEALRDAAYRGNLSRIKEIMSHYPTLNVNAQNEYNETALYIACKKNQNHVAEFLLEQTKIDANIPTIQGNSPLLICTWNDNTELAKKLVEHGVDVQARTNPDRQYHGNISALELAEERGNHVLIDYLQTQIGSQPIPPANPAF